MKHESHVLEVTEANQGQRIDNFLLTYLKKIPKSHIYRILRKGEVRINKKRVKPDYKLALGDLIRIPPLFHDPAATTIKQPPSRVMQALEKCIIYEDPGLLIINKPAGIAVHGGSGLSFGLIETLRLARPKDRFLELVHRLDRETSGCLIIAKKPSVLKELHALLRNGKMQKIYLALVRGHWPKRLQQVTYQLHKNQLQSGERIVRVSQAGKEALTEFRVLKYLDNATLIEAKPITGRTHQIRVHTAHAGYPIACDEKYGDKDFNKQMQQAGCNRLFLHAYQIAFTLSSTQQTISVEAELDQELRKLIE